MALGFDVLWGMPRSTVSEAQWAKEPLTHA